jgi:hypothetical protein
MKDVRRKKEGMAGLNQDEPKETKNSNSVFHSCILFELSTLYSIICIVYRQNLLQSLKKSCCSLAKIRSTTGLELYHNLEFPRIVAHPASKQK